MGVGVHWRNGQARFSEKVDIYGRSLSASAPIRENTVIVASEFRTFRTSDVYIKHEQPRAISNIASQFCKLYSIATQFNTVNCENHYVPRTPKRCLLSCQTALSTDCRRRNVPDQFTVLCRALKTGFLYNKKRSGFSSIQFKPACCRKDAGETLHVLYKTICASRHHRVEATGSVSLAEKINLILYREST